MSASEKKVLQPTSIWTPSRQKKYVVGSYNIDRHANASGYELWHGSPHDEPQREGPGNYYYYAGGKRYAYPQHPRRCAHRRCYYAASRGWFCGECGSTLNNQ
jgi:hypothetical protein